ncbi:MAG: site-specific integrase [Rhodanobacteraceae bacterium]|nr:site-specific integrase [Rhodanobacteraceae bacterium]
MDAWEQSRFDALNALHLRALKLQGKADATVDGYARAVRRVAAYFDRCPDQLSAEDYKTYFALLNDGHSWSRVKIERCGLQFFHQHVLGRQWPWVDRVKAPQVRSLPDVLTLDEIARIIASTRERRYQTFWWTTYRLGLRLGEALNLRVGDIDSARGQVHVRDGRGRKDRFVVLPSLTLACLRRYWREHCHPQWLFPGSASSTTGTMDRGSTQKAFSRVIADCKIRKKVSIHRLRHAHLHEYPEDCLAQSLLIEFPSRRAPARSLTLRFGGGA